MYKWYNNSALAYAFKPAALTPWMHFSGAWRVKCGSPGSNHESSRPGSAPLDYAQWCGGGCMPAILQGTGKLSTDRSPAGQGQPLWAASSGATETACPPPCGMQWVKHGLPSSNRRSSGLGSAPLDYVQRAWRVKCGPPGSGCEPSGPGSAPLDYTQQCSGGPAAIHPPSREARQAGQGRPLWAAFNNSTEAVRPPPHGVQWVKYGPPDGSGKSSGPGLAPLDYAQ
ncbi:hypothetical protein HD554DRAFT_2041884 [Boletus coccyginus]|nr:hypothetical protein HD554DRAFT_2041884 [Boletus coccyginus]